MKAWSAAYRSALANNRVFHPSFNITLTNGSVLSIDEDDIILDSFFIDGSTSSDSEFEVGTCIPEKLYFELDNSSDTYTGYDFDNSVISSLILTLVDGEDTYQIPFTPYNVTEVTYSAYNISITALDNKSKLDVPYSEVGTSYPASLLKITQDIFSHCSLSLGDSTFTNYEYVVSQRPEGDYTCRDVMAMVAQIACSFVYCDRYGQLFLKWYDTESMSKVETDLDGGDLSETGMYQQLFSDYVGTDSGMTVFAEGTYDGSYQTWRLANLPWFGFDGSYPCRLKVNASGHYQFEPYDTVKPDPGPDRDENLDISIWDTFSGGLSNGVSDGNMSMTRLLGQSITIGDNSYYKVRWEGYSEKDSKIEGYRIIYELFIMPNGGFYLHTVTAPTDEPSNHLWIMLRYHSNYAYPLYSKFNESAYEQDVVFDYQASSWRKSSDFTVYTSGDMVSGGRTSPWNTWYSADGGGVESVYQYGYAFDLECGQNDIIITGVKVKSKDSYGQDVEDLVGTEGYVLVIEGNGLISTDFATIAADLGARLVGVKFRTFEGEFLNDPCVEAGDVVAITDIRGDRHNGVVTARTVRLGMSMDAACHAEPPVVNQSAQSSDLTKALIGVKAESQRALTNYEQSVALLTSMMTMAFGVFKTEEEQPDGSVIYYLHDKPDLDESTTIWKMTADAFAVSTDGGTTWNAGIDSSGNATVNVLSAVGIVADWIHGGTLTVGGINNQYGVITIEDASGNVGGTITHTGIDFTDYGTISASFLKSYRQQAYWSEFGEEITDENNETYFDSWLSFNTSNETITYYGMQIRNDTVTFYTAPDVFDADPTFSGQAIGIDLNDAVDIQDHTVGMLSQGMIIYSDGERVLEISPDTDGSAERTFRVYCDMYATNGANFDEICASGSKSRVVKDTAYGDRRLFCYETPTPYFGDIGTARLENGVCFVNIDSIFAETANTDIEYCVFLQKEGQGDIWISEKTPSYFKVEGTADIPFSWELKAVQTGYETYRLEEDSRLRTEGERETFLDEYEDDNFLTNDFAEEISL